MFSAVKTSVHPLALIRSKNTSQRLTNKIISPSKLNVPNVLLALEIVYKPQTAIKSIMGLSKTTLQLEILPILKRRLTLLTHQKFPITINLLTQHLLLKTLSSRKLERDSSYFPTRNFVPIYLSIHLFLYPPILQLFLM